MKANLASVLVVLFMVSTASCNAQRTIRVEAYNDDISNNLDLQAVASTFGDSRNMEDFERRLNDYDSQISNLDLNNDGEIDYLRVIEDRDNNVHVVVIQAVLGREVFQDVATIVLERRKSNRRTFVQVIGHPYLYGYNYVIEPVFVYPPAIYSYLWSYNYQRWHSPYYYGHYPRHYHVRCPYEMNLYMSHIHSHINVNNRYYYSERRMSDYSTRIYQSIGRNDYEKRYPDRNFTSRNKDVENKKTFDTRRSNNTIYDRSNSTSSRVGGSSANNGGSGSRVNSTENTNRSQGNRISDTRNSKVQDDVYQNKTVRSNSATTENTRNGQTNGSRTEQTTKKQPVTSTPRATEIRQNDPNNNLQQRRNAAVTEKPQSVTTRESSSTRSNPVVTQPNRSTDSKAVERKTTESSRSRESSTSSGNRSSSNNTGRR